MSGESRTWRWVAVSALLIALAMTLFLPPSPAAAHPLGNFTVNRYSRLVFAERAVTIVYVLDLAEIPTFQESPRLDTDRDGLLSGDEASAWLATKLPELLAGLRLVVGGEVLELEANTSTATYLPGQGGLPTLRVEALLSAELPDGWEEGGFGGYTDRNYPDRLGWRELVIQGGSGIRIVESSAPSVDVSDELRAYPEDSLSSPLDVAEATFTIEPGDDVATQSDTASQSAARVREETNGGRATDRVAALVTAEELTPPAIAIALLLAMFWGAAHALSPGHGKTVVAAYLVGARGTARHAAFLGLTVTVTHTAGVFALGLITLYLSRYILPENLYPWLSVASGLLVVAIGSVLIHNRLRANMAAGRLHDHHHDHGHDHDHDHDHAHGALTHSHGAREHTHLPPGADGSPVTWRSLLALGVSGGLIPCPSALVLLLGAISLDRAEFGMILVVAFSLGLATVLTAIGLLLVYARRVFERHAFTPRVPRLLPVASALAVCVAGLAILVGSLRQTGIM